MTPDLPRESIWDMRRRAHRHFWAKAQNAYSCAHVLWQAKGDKHDIALYEGFMRESSIAIELILKALIAMQTDVAPDNSHDVYDLWNKAELPELSDDDWMRLTDITEILYWRGRYAAPTSDKNKKWGDARNAKHQRAHLIGKIMVSEHTPYDWEDFERLWAIILKSYWDLHEDEETQLK